MLTGTIVCRQHQPYYSIILPYAHFLFYRVKKDPEGKWSAFKLMSANDTTELFQFSLCKTFRSASESMKCVQQRLPRFMSLISIAQKKPWLHAQEPCNCNYGFWIFGTGSYSRRNVLPSGTVRVSNFSLFIFSEGVCSG